MRWNHPIARVTQDRLRRDEVSMRVESPATLYNNLFSIVDEIKTR